MPLRFLLPVLMLLSACESTPDEPEVNCDAITDKKAAADCKYQEKQKLARQLTMGARGSRP